MSAPARTIKQTNSVGEAAAIMLKYKVNRLPVVNKNGEVIGIVSRTDSKYIIVVYSISFPLMFRTDSLFLFSSLPLFPFSNLVFTALESMEE